MMNTEIIEKYKDCQKSFVSLVLKRNTISSISTCTGKAIISIEIIRKRLLSIKDDINNGKDNKQFVVFLVPTKVLINQYLNCLRSQLPDACVKEFSRCPCDESKESSHKLMKTIEEIDVMIMVPEILRLLLSKEMIKVSMLNCIIIDDVHNAIGRNPMKIVCDIVKRSFSPKKPLIFGMTTSPILCNNNGYVSEDMIKLQNNTNSVIYNCQELNDAINALDALDALDTKLLNPQEPLNTIDSKLIKPKLSLLKYPSDSYQTNSFAVDGISTISATSCSSLFSEQRQLSYEMHPVHILIHSFLRVKHTDFVYYILKVKRHFNLSPSDIYELTQEKIGKPGIILMNSMNLNDDKKFTNISDLQNMFGGIVHIALNCGILTAINALKIVSKSIETSEYRLSQASLNEMGESIVDVTPLMSLKYTDEKKRNLDDSNSFDLNSDRLKKMSSELLDGIFELNDLADVENSINSSLFDMFITLLHCCYNSYGNELLGLALNTIIRKVIVWISDRIAIVTKRIEDFVDIKTDFKVDAFDSNITFEDVGNLPAGSKTENEKRRFLTNIEDQRSRHEIFIKEVAELKVIEREVTIIMEKFPGMKNIDSTTAKHLVKSIGCLSNSLGFVVLTLLCCIHKSFADDSIFSFTVGINISLFIFIIIIIIIIIIINIIGSCDTFKNFSKFYKKFCNDDDLSAPTIQQLRNSIFDGCSALLESIDSFKYLIDLNDPDINSIHLEAIDHFQDGRHDELSAISLQPENSFKIKMISNKLLSVLLLWSLIEKDTQDPNLDNSSKLYDWCSIIFCKTRLTAQTICNALDLVGNITIHYNINHYYHFIAKIAIRSDELKSWFCPPTLLDLSKCQKVRPCCILGTGRYDISSMISLLLLSSSSNE